MSQHYLNYHLKSFINTINEATMDDDNNGNVETETDMLNGNGKVKLNHNNCQLETGKIRITENPLPDNMLSC